MRRPLSSHLPAVVAVLLLASQVADSAGNRTEADPIVARAGASVIESSRIARAFARLHEFQRRRFGATQKAQLRGYVEQIAIRDLLLAERAKQSGLLEAPRVRAQHQLILGDALIESLRKGIERDAPVTDADVKRYYDGHQELFHTPPRLRIFRLLVDKQAEALELIERVKQLPSMDDWRNLVREKSKDKATSERGGDLGFVSADGTTDVPELEVDRSLFAAAQRVKDGEVVGRPVAEGNRFAVLWRRGSLAAKTLDLRQESPRIRQQLTNDRLDAELKLLIAKLRQQGLHDHHPERLEGRDFPPPSEPSVPPSAASAPIASASSEP
jgi:peptidyl-prolyl cis-trans isomerase C